MTLRIVAGVQTNVDFASPSKNLQRVLNWLQDERIAQAHLVVFPECVLSGYCFDSRNEAMEFALSITDDWVMTLSSACRPEQLVAVGFLERGQDHTLYNSCAMIHRGGLLGVYRKIHLPHLGVDRYVDPGQEPFRVWDWNGMRIGPHICYDGGFPESPRTLALLGADILILPTNWPPGAETFAMYLPHARALENNVYYLAVNRVGTEQGFRFIGQSKLCNTTGGTMAEANDSEEKILVGSIDLERARNKKLVRVPGKHTIDRIGDRRPEFYSEICKPDRFS